MDSSALVYVQSLAYSLSGSGKQRLASLVEVEDQELTSFDTNQPFYI